MTLATLADVLQPALKGNYAVGGLVTLGWEDMRAYAMPHNPLVRLLSYRQGRVAANTRPFRFWAKCTGT